MSGRMLTRREAIGMGVAATVAGIVGCDKNEVGEAACDCAIAIGSLVVMIPHPLGRIIGAALILGGGALKVCFACGDGSTKESEVPLSEDEKRKIQRELAAGNKFHVPGPNGKNRYIDAFEEGRGQ